MKFLSLTALLMLASAAPTLALDGELSGNRRIASSFLGYDLQYRVYTPPGVDSLEGLPTIYATDGQSYISNGSMHRILDREIGAGRIKPVVAIFVDARDPDNLRNNRRNSQFFCNIDYVRFFVGELVPEVSDHYPVSLSKDDRVILGLSFGGLNAACFGLMAPGTFGGVAMQSPAIHPVRNLKEMYATEKTRPIKIFFSIGSKNDNTTVGRSFRGVLERKGYDLFYKEVNEGHNWRNWKPLLDDVLMHFFPTHN